MSVFRVKAAVGHDFGGPGASPRGDMIYIILTVRENGNLGGRLGNFAGPNDDEKRRQGG